MLTLTSRIRPAVNMHRAAFAIATRNKSGQHPNVENNTAMDISAFPPRKTNTIINFAKQGTLCVIARFGKFHSVQTPGLFVAYPFIDSIHVVDMRQMVIDVARQHAITCDNVAVSVAAQLYVNATNAETVCYKVQQPLVAVVSQAQSALRIAIGQNDLDHLLKDRNAINKTVQAALSGSGERWGVSVSRFEITELTPERKIQEAMDQQSTAERERRAVVITAEGKRRAMELEAEGNRLSIELEAHAKKKAVELEAEAMFNASKSLENVKPHVLNFWLQNEQIKTMGRIADSGNTSYFMSKDMAQLPVLVDAITTKNTNQPKE